MVEGADVRLSSSLKRLGWMRIAEPHQAVADAQRPTKNTESIRSEITRLNAGFLQTLHDRKGS